MYRIAAVGDIHIRGTIPTNLIGEVERLHDRADVLVVAGDMTGGGRLLDAELAADLFSLARVPVIAVLGNHDRWRLCQRAIVRILERAGVMVLDGTTVVLGNGVRLGFAGVGGSGGGFWPDEGPDTLPRRACQALSVRARREAARLDAALGSLRADLSVVVTHFAPTTSTLGREPLLKHWMLGNCELARVIDRHDVDLVLHGHAHLGNSVGHTAGGTLVRNVAAEVNGGIVVHELAPRPCRHRNHRNWICAEARV